MAFQLQQPFASALKGQVSSGSNANRISCIVDPSSTAAFYGATAVKISGSSNGISLVEKAAATDFIYGFISYSPITNTFAAKDRVEVALNTVIMNMEAGAAISANATLELVATGDKVITSAGTNKIVGRALDAAAASGDIIRVEICPSNSATVF